MDIVDLHKKIYDKIPRFISQSPGRVNIIGEHTDYNGGYALPVAIDRYIEIALSPRNDSLVRIYSGNFKKEGEFSISDLGITQDDELWLKYVKGAFWVLEDVGIPLYGVDLTILGNVPVGAGLSSSAALTVSLLLAIISYAGVLYDKKLIPLYAQRIENEYIGVNCGLMDQIISVFGKKNNALFIDFKTLNFSHIPFELGDKSLIIFNTKASRSLASSAYNERRTECEKGLDILNKCIGKEYKYLGEISLEEFESCKDKLPTPINKRVTHVINENMRVKKACEYLEKKNLVGLGEILFSAHDSLANLYKVSSYELDTAVNVAKNFGVIGARMTGAGFGGCTINIVKKEDVEDFSIYTRREYQKKTGINPEIYKVEVVDGAHIL